MPSLKFIAAYLTILVLPFVFNAAFAESELVDSGFSSTAVETLEQPEEISPAAESTAPTETIDIDCIGFCALEPGSKECSKCTAKQAAPYGDLAPPLNGSRSSSNYTQICAQTCRSASTPKSVMTVGNGRKTSDANFSR